MGGDGSLTAADLLHREWPGLIDEAESGSDAALAVGLSNGTVEFSEPEALHRHVDAACQRPRSQWWMDLLPIARLLAQHGPSDFA